MVGRYSRHMKSNPPPLQIGTPCPKQWETMCGDSRKRYCDHCQLHVHNLSPMSAKERERFVAASDGHACIAYELRPDGSMVTPSRWSWLLLPFQRLRVSVAALLAAFVPFLFSACATRRPFGKVAHTCDASTQPTKDSERVMLLGTPAPPPPPKTQQ